MVVASVKRCARMEVPWLFVIDAILAENEARRPFFLG